MPNKVTRRDFQRQLGTAAVAGIALAAGTRQANSNEAKLETNAARGACNFQASFMTWDHPPRTEPDRRPYARHDIPLGNKARIQLEALVDVVDDGSGTSDQFVLIAACRTEWVYAKNRLFQIPSREYRNIYSLTEERSLVQKITHDCGRPRAQPVQDSFRSLKIDVRRFASSRLLKTAVEINQASERNVPLVGRTEIRDPHTGRRYVLEYPIKTMNFRPENASFQVDTGPVLVPDLSAKADCEIDRMEMAHIAYNHRFYDRRAEFILRRPTPVTDDGGRTVTQVLHYSEIREYPARTVLLAGDDS